MEIDNILSEGAKELIFLVKEHQDDLESLAIKLLNAVPHKEEGRNINGEFEFTVTLPTGAKFIAISEISSSQALFNIRSEVISYLSMLEKMCTSSEKKEVRLSVEKTKKILLEMVSRSDCTVVRDYDGKIVAIDLLYKNNNTDSDMVLHSKSVEIYDSDLFNISFSEDGSVINRGNTHTFGFGLIKIVPVTIDGEQLQKEK